VLSLVVALVVLIPELPPECQAPPTREVSALTGFAQSSGSLSVGLDSVATWCFDSGGTWTGGNKATKNKKPATDPTGDCAKAILSCEAARASVSTEARNTLFDALKDIERPFLGVKYKPKRSGLAERPPEIAECSAKDRSTLFSHAQARMDLARLASQVQNEYANYKTWLFSEGLKCQQALARGEKDYLRRGIAVDTPTQGGGTQQLPTRPGEGTNVGTTGSPGTQVASSGSGTGTTGSTTGTGVGGNITTSGGGTTSLPEKGSVSPSGTSVGGAGSGTSTAGTASKYSPTGTTGTAGSGTPGSSTGTGATANVTTTGGGSTTLPERGSVTPQGSGTGMGTTSPSGAGTGGTSSGVASSGSSAGTTSSSGTPSGTGSATGSSGAVTPNSMGGTLVASVKPTPTGIGGSTTGTTPSGIGVGGPTAEREKALGSSMLDKWRFFLSEQQKIEGDVDWVSGFLASRELRDCHCTSRPIPGEVVRRLENKDRVAQLEADDEKNTRCEVCLLDAFPKWKVRAQKQCALALELSEYELGYLQRSDDGNGLPPRCVEAARQKQAGASKPTAQVTTQQPGNQNTQPKSSGSAYIITKAPDPVMPEMGSYLKPNEYAPIPMREEGRVYVRVFTSSACIAEVLPGPVQARTGDLLPVPPAAKEITVRGACGGFAELYFGKEEKPRVAESFARNQPLRLQFRP
jgi:hypothetical protein